MNIQEGIDLVTLSVSTLFACIFLSLFIGLFNYNHDVQALFEREGTQQKLNQEYAKVVAYDNTVINGQDILSFLTKYKGGIPVIFRKGPDASGTGASEVTITDDKSELEVLRSGSGGTEWPYIIYQYDTASTGTADDTLVKTSTANTVYDATDIYNYSDGTPGQEAAANLTAQEIIDQFSDYIKTFRKDTLGVNDGLYGEWHSTVYYKDISCREPECIEVYPIGGT